MNKGNICEYKSIVVGMPFQYGEQAVNYLCTELLWDKRKAEDFLYLPFECVVITRAIYKLLILEGWKFEFIKKEMPVSDV